MERGGAGACAGAEEGGARCQSEAAAEGDGAEEAEVRSRLAERCFWLLAGLLARTAGPPLDGATAAGPPLDGATAAWPERPLLAAVEGLARLPRRCAALAPRAVEVAPPARRRARALEPFSEARPVD